MIPLPALSAVPWRLVGYGAAAVAIGVLGWRVHAWHAAYKALPEAQAALAAEQACAVGSKCAERVAALVARQAAASEQAVRGYEDEIRTLRDRPVAVRTVRLCRPADPGDVRDAAATGPADGAGPAAGVVSGAAGPDIGPDLYRLARDADEVAARLRALQAWSAALSRPPEPP